MAKSIGSAQLKSLTPEALRGEKISLEAALGQLDKNKLLGKRAATKLHVINNVLSSAQREAEHAKHLVRQNGVITSQQMLRKLEGSSETEKKDRITALENALLRDNTLEAEAARTVDEYIENGAEALSAEDLWRIYRVLPGKTFYRHDEKELFLLLKIL